MKLIKLWQRRQQIPTIRFLHIISSQIYFVEKLRSNIIPELLDMCPWKFDPWIIANQFHFIDFIPPSHLIRFCKRKKRLNLCNKKKLWIFSFIQIYRLPEHVKPIQYDLFLNPDLQTGTYNGNETITLQVSSETNEILLHSHNLNITEVIFKADSKEIQVSRFRVPNRRRKLIEIFHKYFRFNLAVYAQFGRWESITKSEI